MKCISKVVSFFVIAFALIFFSCEKDQVTASEPEMNVKVLDIKGHFVKGDSIRQLNKNLDLFLRARFEQNNSSLTEDITSNTYGFTISTNRILQLVGENYTNYIFSVYRTNATTDILENYMLTVFDTGNYMQVLVAYPMITNNGILEPSILGATVTYINDASLLTGAEMSPCTNIADEIIGWDANVNCIYINCSAGGEHSYGESCEGSPSQQPSRVCNGGWVTTGCMTSGGVGGNNPSEPIGGGQINDDTDDEVEEVPIVPFVPYWLNIVNCVNDGATGSFDNSLPLSSSDISWLQSQTGSVHANAISDYIVENGCDKGFLEKVIEIIQLGGKFDKETGVILDPSFIGTRAECAYNIIKDTNGNLYKRTIDLFTNDPKYKLLLSVGNCNNTDTACTDGTHINTTGIVKITIEDLGEPTLELISTLLHEAVHAEIFRYVSRYQSGVDPNNRPRLFQLYQYYKGLADDPNYNIDNPVTVAQHTYMAEKYVIPIAKAVREIDGNSHPLEYYMWYGWEGLEEYDFQNLLTPALEQQYNQYQTIVNGSTSVNCN